MDYIWASTQENQSSGVCEQQRRRPACASAQAVRAFVIRFLKSGVSEHATGRISIF